MKIGAIEKFHLQKELFYCARKAKTDTASEEGAKVPGMKWDFILHTGILLMIGISFFSELLEHDPFLPSLVEYEIFFFFFSILFTYPVVPLTCLEDTHKKVTALPIYHNEKTESNFIREERVSSVSWKRMFLLFWCCYLEKMRTYFMKW